MTREELLDILDRLSISAGYYCDQGPYKGMIRARIGDAYLTPDQIAGLQKALWEHRKARSADDLQKMFKGQTQQVPEHQKRESTGNVVRLPAPEERE